MPSSCSPVRDGPDADGDVLARERQRNAELTARVQALEETERSLRQKLEEAETNLTATTTISATADDSAVLQQVEEARQRVNRPHVSRLAELRITTLQRQLAQLSAVHVDNRELRGKVVQLEQRLRQEQLKHSAQLHKLQQSRVQSGGAGAAPSQSRREMEQRVEQAQRDAARANARFIFTEKALERSRDQERKLELKIAAAVVRADTYVKPSNSEAAAIAAATDSYAEVYKRKWTKAAQASVVAACLLEDKPIQPLEDDLAIACNPVCEDRIQWLKHALSPLAFTLAWALSTGAAAV